MWTRDHSAVTVEPVPRTTTGRSRSLDQDQDSTACCAANRLRGAAVDHCEAARLHFRMAPFDGVPVMPFPVSSREARGARIGRDADAVAHRAQ